MISCNKYEFESGSPFLAYGENMEFPEEFKIKLIEENVDPSKPENCKYPLLKFSDFQAFRVRTRDKILASAGISSYQDLANAYFLIKTKELNKSKRVRDAVEEKYVEVIELVKV